MKFSMAEMRSLTLVKVPRRMAWRVMMPKKISTHLLLQTRTRALNDELAADFHRWYPGFAHTADRQALAV